MKNFFISLCLAFITVSSAAAAKPSVLFILVDDLSWADLGFNGSAVYETPNVDRLAGDGMVFSDFYSGGPVCSPTRASILTGKYTARTGITTYLLSRDRDAAHVTSHLPLEELTLAEAFKKNGYVTAYIGKWHLGYESEYWAANQGFDLAKGGIDLPWAWTACFPGSDAPTSKTWRKGHTRFFSPHHLTHLENGPEGEYLTDRLTDEMITFIEQDRDRPFFAFLSYHTVHTPLEAKPEVVERYRQKITSLGLELKKEKDKREKAYQNLPEYAAMVHHMDENVGRLLHRIDDLGLSNDTIVVFTSDNGGKGSVTSNLPLRGMKHNLYEGGIRVPLIVRWPGRIKAGTTSSVPLISNDFYPTLLELSGCELEPDQHVDGVSFAAILTGGSEAVDRDAIYWHYPHGRQEAAIREGRFKLLHRFERDTVELYDLEADMGERHDLSEAEPETAGRLLAKLKGWQNSVGARFARPTKSADARPAAPQTELTIVAFGDSTTAPRHGVDQVYADRLPDLLATTGARARVINAGVGGSHTGRLTDNARHKRRHALDRFDEAVRAHDPDIVIIQFGINDSWVDSNDPGDKSRISLEAYERNLRHIVTTLKNDGTRVILMTPNTLGERFEAWRHQRLSGYVAAVREIAEDHAVALIDVAELFAKSQGGADRLLLDGSHPNDSGHDLIAEAIAALPVFQPR